MAAHVHRFTTILVLAACLAPATAQAEEGTSELLSASMTCDRAIEPGRVRCTVDAHAEGQRVIPWADVTIATLPPNTAALKGRIGPADATLREPAHARWALGLVAKTALHGEARAKVRAVVCDAPPASAPVRCAPVVVDVHAILDVGN